MARMIVPGEKSVVLGYNATITFLKIIINDLIQQLVNESPGEKATCGLGPGSLLGLL